MPTTISFRLPSFVLGVSIVAALLALPPIAPAKADKVGVAAAVKPDAFSEGKEVKIGNSVFYNQRINTSGEGLVQVLLVDGSTFTVGPGSDLVIDKFVYDPNKKQGEVVATFSKGVLRFVGGKISKNEGGVTVNTPAGALAIRGGMFQGKVDHNGGVFSFLFGVEMKFTGHNGQVSRVYSPNYTLVTGGGGVPVIRPTRPEDTQMFMRALAGGGKVVVGGANNADNKPHPGSLFPKKVEIVEVTEEGTQNIIAGQLDHEEHDTGNPPPPPPPSTNPNARVMTAPTTYTASLGSENPASLDSGYDTPGAHGVLGGGNDSQETSDDFSTTMFRDGNRLIGAFEADTINSDGEYSWLEHIKGSINLPDEFPSGSCSQGVCLVGDGFVQASITSGEVQHTEQRALKGSAISVGSGFVAYQLFFADNETADGPNQGDAISHPLSHVESDYSPDLTFAQRIDVAQGLREAVRWSTGVDLNDPVLIFAGKKFNIPAAGQIQQFQLFTDPRQSIVLGSNSENSFRNFVVPFATLEASPLNLSNGANAQVSNLALLEKDSNPQSRAVWLQTSLYINDDTEGDGQESVVVVALGEMSNQTGLTGNRRGGSSLIQVRDGEVAGTEPISFTGGIATLAAPNGAHFMGDKTPNIVIGADSTGDGHDIFVDKPLSNDPDDSFVSSTTHVGVGLPGTKKSVQTSGTFLGYAAGVYQQTSDNLEEGENPVGALVSASPNDVAITFNAKQNTLSATLNTNVNGDPSEGGMSLALGDSDDTHGRSAFIDNNHYAAIETPGQSSIRNGIEGTAVLTSAPTGYMISGDQLGVTNLFPETFAKNGQGVRPFCSNCGYMTWGAWGANAGFKDNNNAAVTANVHLGWWVAGDVVDNADLPQMGGADYNGHAIATVANNISGNGWKTYVATGNMDMHWNFQAHNGSLNISDFDKRHIAGGLDFSGNMTAPGVLAAGPNKFSGSLNGVNLPTNLNGLGGSATGSFVNGPKSPVQGVIGNWNVSKNNVYGAAGIFAGGAAGGGPPH